MSFSAYKTVSINNRDLDYEIVSVQDLLWSKGKEMHNLLLLARRHHTSNTPFITTLIDLDLLDILLILNIFSQQLTNMQK
jgi:hypothetical protein